MTGQWFSPGTPVSSSNKADCQDINEILLKVALNTINHQPILAVRRKDVRVIEYERKSIELSTYKDQNFDELCT